MRYIHYEFIASVGSIFIWQSPYRLEQHLKPVRITKFMQYPIFTPTHAQTSERRWNPSRTCCAMDQFPVQNFFPVTYLALLLKLPSKPGLAFFLPALSLLAFLPGLVPFSSRRFLRLSSRFF